MVADTAGNLYGMALDPGTGFFVGAIFELSPPKAGGKRWTFSSLYKFNPSSHDQPAAGLIMDGAGNLFGTCSAGGAYTWGTVFELRPPAPGEAHWTQTTLHSFNVTDGEEPQARLVMDGTGHLYGTTLRGGTHGDGVVFELSPPAPGKTIWTERVLHNFDGTNGANPAAGLIADSAGNLYGDTTLGGAHNDGVVFELRTPAPGEKAWTEKVLHVFNGANGMNPEGELIADGAGNLYGTAQKGGANGAGVAIELSPPAQGANTWTVTAFHAFDGANGTNPWGALTSDGQGSFYGGTEIGGAQGVGSIFRFTP
jgi:uncharacterized repeat protein (TIGR03803 family)